jgi:adenylate cyclase
MIISEKDRRSTLLIAISDAAAVARALIAPAPPAPARIRAAVGRFEAQSDQIAALIQLGGLTLFAALYAATYSSFTVHHTIEPAPVALVFYGAFTMWRLRAATGPAKRPPRLYVSAAVDIIVLYALIAAFPHQYGAPSALFLKAPTLLYVFILIGLRTLWFDPRLTLFTGAIAAVGWGALTLLAAIDGAPFTGDYRIYMTSLSLLPGAELEKIAAIAATTLVLAAAVHRARTLLYRTATEETAAADLTKFVGKDAAARIRASDTGLRAGDGELRRAAIMMIDLRGFTAATKGLPPAEVIGILQEYQSRIVPIIEEGGGTIDKFLGDGVLVSFGAAHDTGAECVEAARTAFAVAAAADRWKEARARAGRPTLDIGIAITAGDVVFGAVGHGDRLEFTVIGDAVNLAAKLEKHAKLERCRIIATAEVVDRAASQGRAALQGRRIAGAHVDGAPGPVDLVALG